MKQQTNVRIPYYQLRKLTLMYPIVELLTTVQLRLTEDKMSRLADALSPGVSKTGFLFMGLELKDSQ